LVSFPSIKSNPELINERLRPGKGIKTWDKIYWVLATSLFFITIILAALDSGRFQWSPDLPVYIYAAAALLYIIGYLIFAWARRTNNFFSSVVRIQKDRGQTVCQDGPYNYVRHPGYLGGFLYTSVTPLLLGSLWALIPTGITVVLMLVRTGLEDKTLTNELEGYKEYKARVKYRLIPFVW
jgi:protein-S-isoprenylcysteine O-methyltransferase Ste14